MCGGDLRPGGPACPRAAPEGSLARSCRRGTELSFGKDAHSLLLLAVAGKARETVQDPYPSSAPVTPPGPSASRSRKPCLSCAASRVEPEAAPKEEFAGMVMREQTALSHSAGGTPRTHGSKQGWGAGPGWPHPPDDLGSLYCPRCPTRAQRTLWKPHLPEDREQLAHTLGLSEACP